MTAVAAAVSISVDTSQIEALARVIDAVPAGIRDVVIPRSLNDVGDQVFTAVKRSVAQQTGATAGRVAKALDKKRATPGVHVFKIVASDRFMSLKDFGPKQTKKGISSAPWKKRRVFPGTFFGPGGHVYKRTGKSRLPIEKLYGPAIPREMIRDATAGVVLQIVNEKLPKRIEYWTMRILAQGASAQSLADKSVAKVLGAVL